MREGDSACAQIHARQPPNPSYDEVSRHPLYDEWWRARALDTIVDRVTVPTLLIHGWQDEWIRPNGALRLFQLLKSPHKKLLLQNGPHTLIAYRVNQTEQIRWLDRWVKQERNGVDHEPSVTVLWEMTESQDSADATPAWTTTYPTWPVPNLQWSTLYLGVTGELTRERRADHEGVRSYVYPLGTELVGNSGQFTLAPHPLGTLSYRTAPMTSDVVVLGSPQLTFFFSTGQTDTDFMFVLKDIDPAGNVLFLQRAVLRASLRGVDQELSTPDEVVQSFVKTERLVPGEVYEARLSLSALGHVVRTGHRLELSILAPGPIPNPVWGFAPVSAASINTIYHGESHPSQLRLPVVPGEKAQKPAPALGALRNQPCRPDAP